MEETETKPLLDTLVFEVDLENPLVAAHFPGKPIIAAYMQMEWVERLCQKAGLSVHGVRNVKFLSEIVPPCEVTVAVGKESGAFTIEVAGEVKTKGKVTC
jgi:3-hydroxymyristoyl/3-hydroxydecanoyl-(acyl carrier protein) dehydratase